MPQMIGLFLWIAYFDQIPQETLSAGGIGWPVLPARALAGWLCYLWLYRPSAMWGMTTGHPLWRSRHEHIRDPRPTFGSRASLLAGVGVVWLAVLDVKYATDLCLASWC